MNLSICRRMSFAAAAAFAATCAAGDVEVLRERLARGPRQIALVDGALPGCVVTTGGDAIPLAFGRVGGTKTAVAAASSLEAGRAVAVTHHGFFEGKAAERRENKAFLRECISWLAGGKSPAVVHLDRRLMRLKSAIERALAGTGARIEPLAEYDALASLPKGSVVVTMPDSHSLEDAKKLTAFMRRGGGVFAPVVGWGWHQISGGQSFGTRCPFNAALGPSGIYSCGASAEPAGGGLYDVTGSSDLPGLTAESAIELVEGSGLMPKALGARCLFTLESLATALPPTDVQWLPKIEALAQAALAGIVPSPSRPLGNTRVRERLAFAIFQNAWLANPERAWPASAAAATYPGLPVKGTRRETRDVEIDLSVPRWHGTGLFAAAGEPLTVTLPDGAEKKGLSVRVGSTSCRLSSRHGEWKRAPVVDVTLPLVKKTTTFASPFGGLVYIVVPNGATGRLKVKVGPACPAPWFVEGRDTPETWVAQLRGSPAPFVEIESEHLVITVPYACVQALADPRPLLQVWREIMANDARLTGIPVKRASPERICADVQLCAGYMHAGYPIMMPVACMRHLLNERTIRAGEEDDVWGFFHEMGHNHQNYDWTFNGTTEVTVNLFTLYNMERICGRSLRQNEKIGGERFRRKVEKWNAAGRPADQWFADPFLALDFFVRLVEKYGWESFEKVFAEYRSLPQSERPKTDLEKREQLCRRLSRVVGEDLSGEFRFLGVRPLDEKTRKKDK